MKTIKLIMITLMMCFVITSYAQSTIVMKNNDIITATKIKYTNVPTENPNIWIKGIYYTDKNGSRQHISMTSIKSIDNINPNTEPKSNNVNIKKDVIPTNNLNLGGYYIEQGAKIKNTSILISLIGVGLTILSVTKPGNPDSKPLIFLGEAAIVASFTINIVGNRKIAKGGNLIKKFE